MQPIQLHLLPTSRIHEGTPRKVFNYANESRLLNYIYFTNKGKDSNDFKEKYPKLRSFLGNNILFNYYNKSLINNLSLVKSYVKKNNITIIHCYFPKDNLLCFILKYFLNIVIIRHFEGIYSSPKKIHRFAEELSFKKTDYFIYISKYVKLVKQKDFPVLLKKPSSTISNGVLRREEKNKIYFFRKKYNFLTISSFQPTKNLILLLDIINYLKISLDEDFVFHILGKTNTAYFKTFSKLMYRRKLENYIKVWGCVEEVYNFIHGCDLYLHPAHEEGFGIAIVEAMLEAQTVLVSNKGGPREYIENGKTGFILKHDDAEIWATTIIKLINNEELKINIGKNAQVSARAKFPFDEFVNSIDKIAIKLKK